MTERSNGHYECQEFGYDTSFSTIDTELEKELQRARPLVKFDNAVCRWYLKNSDSLNLSTCNEQNNENVLNNQIGKRV